MKRVVFLFSSSGASHPRPSLPPSLPPSLVFPLLPGPPGASKSIKRVSSNPPSFPPSLPPSLVSLPITAWASRRIQVYQTRMMKKKDARMSVMSEILQGKEGGRKGGRKEGRETDPSREGGMEGGRGGGKELTVP